MKELLSILALVALVVFHGYALVRMGHRADEEAGRGKE